MQAVWVHSQRGQLLAQTGQCGGRVATLLQRLQERLFIQDELRFLQGVQRPTTDRDARAKTSSPAVAKAPTSNAAGWEDARNREERAQARQGLAGDDSTLPHLQCRRVAEVKTAHMLDGGVPVPRQHRLLQLAHLQPGSQRAGIAERPCKHRGCHIGSKVNPWLTCAGWMTMPEASSSCCATSSKPKPLSACSMSRMYWVRSIKPRRPSGSAAEVVPPPSAASEPAGPDLSPGGSLLGDHPLPACTGVLPFVMSESLGRLLCGAPRSCAGRVVIAFKRGWMSACLEGPKRGAGREAREREL